MAARKTSKRVVKKPAAKRGKKARSAGRTLNEILIALGRQALQDGVRDVIEAHGIDSGVQVELALTKPRRPGKAKKPARRRAKRG